MLPDIPHQYPKFMFISTDGPRLEDTDVLSQVSPTSDGKFYKEVLEILLWRPHQVFSVFEAAYVSNIRRVSGVKKNLKCRFNIIHVINGG